MKSVKYPDASLKKFFSLNPAVLFSLFQPAIWWAFYILLPFMALIPGATFIPESRVGVKVSINSVSMPHLKL